MARVLVSDPVDPVGVEILQQVAHVDVLTNLAPDKLLASIGEYDALMVRSETKVTSAVIEAGDRLKIIGRAGVGVDNIDVPAATRRGIIVVNSPGGNTIAAAEHTLALMMALARHIPQADQSVRANEWTRAKFLGVELYQKTLGILGLGKIGSHVAKVARALGMNVLAYDPYISPERASQWNAQLVDLETLIRNADFITLHLPKTPETTHLINQETLAKMKPSCRIVNCSRGGIVDENALYQALKSKQIAGAALDVFAQEPLKESLLRDLGMEVILTPHLGASTEEAQANVAIDVAEQIRDVLLGLPAKSAVNIPGLNPDILQQLKPYLLLAETLGSLVGQLAGGRVDTLEIRLQGVLAEKDAKPLLVAALKGLLTPALRERVNYVNALIEARERGIHVIETRDSSGQDYTGSLYLEARTSGIPRSISGTLLGEGEARITCVDGLPINVAPSQFMLLTNHQDMPGIIGRVGSLLGSQNVNIGGMQVGRQVVRGEAVMVVSLDDPLPEGILKEIKSMPGIRDAYVLAL
ncbi:phosphoglycerate dehydrogenase [Candidatus Cyanaurora vandensis]|uniref:phosphoglycerate dehydrogenase n=1 Tax=Candidatus Cyanaurora vandensis TaxID=2714958 RepID=UPI002580E9DD|nr:phosphoglycerate dehydrogenase [Candidatus Cyanaurora vandensis]